MSDIASFLDSVSPLFVILTALGLVTGAFRLIDPDERGSKRGVGGAAMIAAGLLFLYVGIAAGGGVPRLEQALRDAVSMIFT